MAADDETFPEFAMARDGRGVCFVCEAGPGEEHDVRAHDRWDAAEDATWD